MGSSVNASAVSEITIALDEQVRPCHPRRLPVEAVYLFSDQALSLGSPVILPRSNARTTSKNPAT
jgi:hypothetical protein